MMIKSFTDFDEAISSIRRIKPDDKCIELIGKLAKDYGVIPGNLNNYENTIHMDNIQNVPMLHFFKLDEFKWIKQAFSTRIGGVSEGVYESMNLSFNLFDSYENVLKNFKIISKSIAISTNNMVYSKQTHTTNILVADESNLGMGVERDRDFDNIDGLVTDKADLCLVTSFADCIPVVIIDPVHRAIASLHAGWRGTVGNIADNAVKILKKEYGSEPSDLYAFIGPGICKNCYEVGADVAEKFLQSYTDREADIILDNKGIGTDKWLLNLTAANRINLIRCGINDCNIYTADVCTNCNPQLLWSHRATKGKRGIACNFLMIQSA